MEIGAIIAIVLTVGVIFAAAAVTTVVLKNTDKRNKDLHDRNSHPDQTESNKKK